MWKLYKVCKFEFLQNPINLYPNTMRYFLIILLLTVSNLSAQNLNSESKVSIQDSLAFELCKIYGFDQGIRDRSLAVAFTKHSQEIDTLNFKKIVAFVKEHGYPTEKLLGERNMKHECVELSFVAVLLHNPHRLVNEKDLAILNNTISTLDRVSRQNIPLLSPGVCIITGTAMTMPITVQVLFNKNKELRPNSDTIDLIKLWEE